MGAAIGAKHLRPVVAAFRRFDIGLRRARQESKVFFLGDDTDTKSTT